MKTEKQRVARAYGAILKGFPGRAKMVFQNGNGASEAMAAIGVSSLLEDPIPSGTLLIIEKNERLTEETKNLEDWIIVRTEGGGMI